MAAPRLDLHTHTTLSDGTCEPETLVERAAAAGVTVLAITDHEHVDGTLRATAAARTHGIALIAGVELEAASERGLLHVLGYGIDPDSAKLRRRLDDLRRARLERNEALTAALERTGTRIALADVAAAEGLPADQLGIRHFVKALVRMQIGDAAPLVAGCAVPALAKPDAETCITWIVEAGGSAVLAHPSTLRLDGAERTARIGELVRAGLAGVEVVHPSHTPELEAELARLASDAGLLATGGSDYHGDRRPGRSLGIDSPRVSHLERLGLVG